MQSTVFVFGLVVVAAVLVKQGDARPSLIRELLLDEIRDNVRQELNSLLDTRELEPNMQDVKIQGRGWSRPGNTNQAGTGGSNIDQAGAGNVGIGNLQNTNNQQSSYSGNNFGK